MKHIKDVTSKVLEDIKKRREEFEKSIKKSNCKD